MNKYFLPTQAEVSPVGWATRCPHWSLISTIQQRPLFVRWSLLLIMVLAIPLNIYGAIELEKFQVRSDFSEISQKLQKIAQKTDSIKSEFIQEKYLSILTDRIISQGLFFFQKPEFIRWEYLDPYKYQIIINQNKMSIKDEDKTNSINLESSKLFKLINELILGSISGSILEKSDNYVIQLKVSQNYYLLEMNPQERSLKKLIRTIQIFFNKQSEDIEIVKIIEQSDDYTRIQFKNRKLNIKLPDDTFNIPKTNQ